MIKSATISLSLFFIISLSLATFIFQNLLNENRLETVFIIYSYIIFIFFLEIATIIFLYQLVKKNFVLKFFIIFFLFINFCSLILFNSFFFINFLFVKKIFIIIISYITILILSHFILFKKKFVKIIIILYSVLIIDHFINASDYVYYKIYDVYHNREYNQIKSIDKIKFKNTPNIYIFSFESMISPTIAKKHLGISNLGYVDLLKKEKFYIFKNNFSDTATTANSLNSTVFLNHKKWSLLPEKHKYKFYSGEKQSPLSTIIKNNEYYYLSGYIHPSLLGTGGNFVDIYKTGLYAKEYKKYNASFCDRLNNFYNLFGYCRFISKQKTSLEEKKLDTEKFYKHIISLIDKKEKLFFTVHFRATSHPDSENLGMSFKNLYYKQSFMVKNYLELIVAKIKQDDPDSLLLIFGDHGLNLNQFLKEDDELLNEVKSKYKNRNKFYAVDRFANLAALYDPNNYCIDYFKKNEKKYYTNSMIVNNLISCLSGDNLYFADIVYENYLNEIYE